MGVVNTGAVTFPSGLTYDEAKRAKATESSLLVCCDGRLCRVKAYLNGHMVPMTRVLEMRDDGWSLLPDGSILCPQCSRARQEASNPSAPECGFSSIIDAFASAMSEAFDREISKVRKAVARIEAMKSAGSETNRHTPTFSEEFASWMKALVNTTPGGCISRIYLDAHYAGDVYLLLAAQLNNDQWKVTLNECQVMVSHKMPKDASDGH